MGNPLDMEWLQRLIYMYLYTYLGTYVLRLKLIIYFYGFREMMHLKLINYLLSNSRLIQPVDKTSLLLQCIM